MNNEKKFLRIDKKIKIFDLAKIFDGKKTTKFKAKIAIKFHKKDKIEGIITLGDLRRLILNNKGQDLAYNYLNTNPYFLSKNTNIQKLENYEQQLKKIIVSQSENILIDDKYKELIDILDYSEIEDNHKYKSVCVVGLGHIGLPLAMHLLKNLDFITGYDNNKGNINKIKKSKINFFEPGLQPLLNYNLKNSKIRLTSDLKEVNSNVYIVCLGSDLDKRKRVNNENIVSTLKKIGKKIYKDNIVLIRGTTQVGFTNKIAKKILENTSGLVCGKDFFLGHIPERIVEGKAMEELQKLPQIVSGSTKRCFEKSRNFCTNFFTKTIDAESCEESEIIKLSSNAFRDLNFAFANEISRISSLYNLSGHNLIDKANSGYERNYISKPSLGVGGFCLPKDVILFKTPVNKKFEGYKLFSSRLINDQSVLRVAKLIIKAHKNNSNKRSKILILGATFKGMPETIDIRNSPSMELSEILSKNNIKNLVYDVNGVEIGNNNSINSKFLFDIKKIEEFETIVLSNNNTKYKDILFNNILNKINKKNKFKIIFDCWNMLDKKVCESAGHEYHTL